MVVFRKNRFKDFPDAFSGCYGEESPWPLRPNSGSFKKPFLDSQGWELTAASCTNIVLLGWAPLVTSDILLMATSAVPDSTSHECGN